MSEWQPIETAPFRVGGTPHFPKKVCDPILAWNGKNVFIAQWLSFGADWVDMTNGWERAEPQPTHWMPLPTPPST